MTEAKFPEAAAANGGIASDLGAALDRLRIGARETQVLRIRPDDRVRLDRAVERVRSQLFGRPEPGLTIALAGCTGAGKSTLINALARASIAESSEIRPTTRGIKVYHHADIVAGGLPKDLVDQARFVAHDRPELRLKVLVDTPDLDSFATEHRDITKALLKAAHLVLYVFSPEKNMEERVWSVLRDEVPFSHAVVVLNKADQASPRDLEMITEDIRRRFADVGLPDIRIFRTCALAHVPRPGEKNGKHHPTPSVDQLAELRAFIEEELRDGDVMRMIRAQRQRVIDALAREVDRIAPEGLKSKLDEVADEAEGRAGDAADKILASIGNILDAAEEELAPLAVVRQHERFRGPFRGWLSMTDFLHYGLWGIVGRLVGRPPRGESQVLQRIFQRHGSQAVEDVLRGEARALQDRLHALGFPSDRWRERTSQGDGERMLAQVADEIRARFEEPLTRPGSRARLAIALGSFLGGIVPLAASVGLLYVLGRDFLRGQYDGLALLAHALAMVLLFFVALHMLINALLLGTARGQGRQVGREAVRSVTRRVLLGWLEGFRDDVAADLALLHGPLASIRHAAEVSLDLEASSPAATSATNGAIPPLPAPAAEAIPEPKAEPAPPPSAPAVEPRPASPAPAPRAAAPTPPPTTVQPEPASANPGRRRKSMQERLMEHEERKS